MPYSIAADDLELWLTGYLRAALAGLSFSDMFVSNVDPPAAHQFQVRVRFDGGVGLSQVTEESSFGITVTGPANDTTGKQTADFATAVRQAIVRIPLEDAANPVVRVESVPRFTRVLGTNVVRPARYCPVRLITVAEEPTAWNGVGVPIDSLSGAADTTPTDYSGLIP